MKIWFAQKFHTKFLCFFIDFELINIKLFFHVKITSKKIISNMSNSFNLFTFSSSA